MKNRMRAVFLMSTLFIGNSFADEIEEVVVTASFIDQTLNEIENPLHVVTGDDIAHTATQSLGESLDNLLGVSSADYGAGVGQPIIRGLSGNRVKILTNGMVLRDVAGIGADHINDVDLNRIQQVEVVRGPSSLLYSNGTIGGIINIVDNTIAKKDFSSPELNVGLEGQSVNEGEAYDLSYVRNIDGWNFSAAYKDADFGNFDIPKGAVLHSEEEHEEYTGFLSNSDYESRTKRFGVSRAGDFGHVGISYNVIKSLYGIPFHGEEHEGEHEEERIFSTTDSETINLEGSYEFNDGWLKSLDYYIRDSDYSLTEQHAEGEEEHEEGPTLFKNDAIEYGAIFDLTNDLLSQKVVINLVEEDISVIGTEAFMNPSESEEITLGYYLSNDLGLFHLDFGVRHDQISRKGSVTHKEEHEEEHEEDFAEIDYYDKDVNNTSFALSLGRQINDSFELTFGLASVERAPSVSELFMNGPHLATGRFEVGNANLKSERSNNIDLSLDYENSGFFAVLTFFRNEVDNYVYLEDETEAEHDDHGEAEHGGLPLANYLQQDAELDGYELEFGKVFEMERGNLSMSFARDSVSGDFKSGGYIPRIVPARNIYSLSYFEDDLEVKLSLKDVSKQKDVSMGESSTMGYQMLNLRLYKSFELNPKVALSVSAFANNLLDEVARNHTSFVKNEVPLPGRNFGLKLNLKY